MKIRSILFVVVSVALIVGCTAQPIARPSISAEARIGVVNLVKPTITHTHVGTTVFNNSVKTYARPWQPSAYLYQQAKAAIESSGNYTVVNVAPSQALASYQGDFIDLTFTSFKLDDAIAPELDRLAAAEKVDLLLILRETSWHDTVTNTNQNLTGYGLYTRSFLGVNEAFVYANVFPVIVQPSPARIVSGGSGFILLGRDPEEIPGFVFPADVKELSDADLEQIDTSLRAILLDAARTVGQELGGQ